MYGQQNYEGRNTLISSQPNTYTFSFNRISVPSLSTKHNEIDSSKATRRIIKSDNFQTKELNQITASLTKESNKKITADQMSELYSAKFLNSFPKSIDCITTFSNLITMTMTFIHQLFGHAVDSFQLSSSIRIDFTLQFLNN